MPYLPDARTAIDALLALAAGLVSGVVNLWALGAAGTRMADSGSARPFVLSSLMRLGVFAIVAVAFAALAPWWTSVIYIVALFVPLAWYAANVLRER